MYFMLAELDDLTPAQFCVEYAERLRAAGNAKIEVKLGDHVTGGETVLARIV